MSKNRQERTDFLQKLVEGKKLTQDGKDWLLCALDPYHDFNHQIAGYPDADTSHTVVSCYPYQVTVTKPVGVVGDWNCHIFNLPVCATNYYNVDNETPNWGYVAETAVPSQAYLGPLNIIKGAPGDPLWPQNPAIATNEHEAVPVQGVADLASGCSRIIGMGFEIHNTTADIHKQGSLVTYRMPQAGGDHCAYYTDHAGTRSSVMSGKRYTTPPVTSTEAQRLRSARSWSAKDGAYCNCFQSEIQNPIRRESNQMISFGYYPSPGIGSQVVTSQKDGAGATNFSPFPQKTTPFDTTGVFLTGLSEQTSLLVKLRMYVERAPTIGDTTLTPLASPSAGYDITALQLYAQAINMLPCGVKVDENAMGDWFRAVVSVLRHAAGPIGQGLNYILPGAGIVGNAVQSVLAQFDKNKSVSKQAAAAAIKQRPRVVLQPKQLAAQKAKLKAVRK